MAINFNTEPYNDDYDAEKDFYKILFRPGYAVQARELTQLQTILQQQVTRFGDHVFKNGSQVIPGSVNYDHRVHFVKLNDTYSDLNVKSYLTQFRNKIITGVTSGVKYRVIDTSECGCVVEQLEILTVYCKFEKTAPDGTTSRFIPGEDIVALEADNQIATNPSLVENQQGDIYATIRNLGDGGESPPTLYSELPSSDVMGYAFQVDVKEGIYYVDGYFIRNPELHLYVGRFQSYPTARVGFKVVEEVVTSDDDETLLDNAQGSFNYAAPGADRYKISVELVKLPLQSTDSIRFIELLRVVDGIVQYKLDKASYSELEKTLARRTYDESGNYEVNKFKLSVREHLDDGTNFGVYPPVPESGPITSANIIYGDEDKFALIVDPGKAYIAGYEVESTTTQYLGINKARETVVDNVIDEGGHIVRLEDQPIGLQMGNYVLVKNVYNVPGVNTFEQVYLVNKLTSTPGNAPAANTIVGTARVKYIELHSSDYTGGTGTAYKLGLFDISMSSGYSFTHDVKQIVGTGASNNFSCDINPTLYQLQGTASASTGSATVTGVGTNFSEILKAGDVIFINGTFIGRVSATPTNNLSLTLDANAAATVSGGVISQFHATLYEPQFDTLLFPVGAQYVKTLRGYDTATSTDSIKSSQVTVKRVITAAADGTGLLSIQLTNPKEFFLPNDLDNYTVFDNVTKLPVNITAGSITFNIVGDVSDDTPRKTVNFSGLVASRSYTLVASVLQIETAASEKTKTLITNYVGDIITTKKSVTSSVVELTKADVLRIKNIYMTPGDYSAFNASNQIDITDRYTLDDGQRSTHYTNAKLILKPGYQVPSGAIKVVYDYFQVSGTGNYFSVDSYSTIPYEDIPSYFVTDPVTKNKTEISLTNVLDFRPIIAGTNTWYPEMPSRGNDANAPMAYYVGRRDKVVLDSVGRFNVIGGVPSKIPQEPEDPKEGLVIATIFIPPYTKNVGDIKIYQRDNRRYTMKDIGKLDRRISNLEYYMTLNMLEKDTETLQIKDTVTGLDKFKNGFVVDQFTGHGVGDVKNPDYRCSTDSELKVLRPMHFTTAIDVVEELSSGAARATKNYQKTGDLLTLPYTETLLVFNPNASRMIDVNPYKIGAYRGQVYLVPENDSWKDTERRPDLNVVDDDNYDAIKFMAEQLGVTGTKWNEWTTNWTGSSSTSVNFESTSGFITQGFQQTTTVDTGTRDRSGTLTTLQSSVNSQDYGDRVVDVAYAPYMRAKPVTFVAKNLKPNTIFYPFFDSVDIGEYVMPSQVLKVTAASPNTFLEFNPSDLQEKVLVDDPYRTTWNGVAESAFEVGDVIQNEAHAGPVNITAINHLTSPGYSFTLTVSNATGVEPGHHVIIYNLANFRTHTHFEDRVDYQIPMPQGNITPGGNTSQSLNMEVFEVSAKSGNTLTLKRRDDSIIPAFEAYDITRYIAETPTRLGQLYRLRASGVVVYAGTEYGDREPNSNKPVTQDLHVVNMKHAFALNDIIVGRTQISTGGYNRATVNTINGVNSAANVAAARKKMGTAIRTDEFGTAVGVFYIPNNDNVRFRTGEREFKLIDNISNTDAAFDSVGRTNFNSQGISLSKERTIVSSREAEFAQDRLFQTIPVRRTSVSTRLLYTIDNTPVWSGGGDGGGDGGGGHDPLAQTFTIVSKGGCFVTSVDLYFSETGTRPVIVELRNTNNGVPSSKVLPFSTVIKNPSDINVSENASAITTFTFDSPIYLQDGETYALVVKTDEPGCQIFCSELGQTDVLTNNIIARQPLTGSLYLAQNSKEFEINPLLDLKFTLRKAVFDTSVTSIVSLKTTPPQQFTLPVNPIEITPNTTKVRVYAPNHGHIAGDTVNLSGFMMGYRYGGSTQSYGFDAMMLNGNHTILSDGLDKDSFVIDIDINDDSGNSILSGTTANFVKGEYGGSGITCTRGAFADGVYLKTNDLSFQDTSLKYYVDSQDLTGTFSGFLPMVSNANYFFPIRKQIKAYENQTVIGGVNKSSMRFEARMRSDNTNVSPVIDLQQLSSYVIANLVDDYSQTDLNVAEIDSRELLGSGDIVSGDVTIAGTGQITCSTASAIVNGTSTLFLSQGKVKVGNILKRQSDGATIGTVLTIDNDSQITLTANAAITIATNSNYNISAAPTLSFSNSNGLGVISTNIDTADNILANATIGKYITISNAHSNVDGSYVIRDVKVIGNTTTFAGNSDSDAVNIYVYPAFTGSASIDMITDLDFSIVQHDKYVEDFSPVGSTNAANYITRTLSLVDPADNIKIIFDASIVSLTDVKVYYRTWEGEVDLKKLPWVDSEYSNPLYNSEGIYTERTIDVTGLAPFKNVQVKLVMRSMNPSKVPLLKNFRLVAYS